MMNRDRSTSLSQLVPLLVLLLVFIIGDNIHGSSGVRSGGSFFAVHVYASAPVSDNDKQDVTATPTAEATTPTTATFQFVHKTVIIPHDQKKHRGGEDAASTTDRLLVVADGVGGWASKGVNPGLFSRLLTKTIVELFTVHTEHHKKKQSSSLVDIVDQANKIAASKHLGSATCTAVQLVGPDQLQTLNIGDSGYSIHRYSMTDNKWKVVFSSEAGQKSFNFPYQIGGQYGDDVKEVADEHTHTIQDGDVIVLYSDGVSDNLYPHQYHECIDQYYYQQPQNINNNPNLISYSLVADCIARQAYVLGKDKYFDSPFAQGARSIGKRYMGGKHDDITVTVAQVVKENTSSSNAPSPSSSPSSSPTTTNTPESIDALLLQVQDEDPHYSESIFIYTGDVPSKEELPTLEQVLEMKRSRKASTGGGADDEL